jgi:hypothetical protein
MALTTMLVEIFIVAPLEISLIQGSLSTLGSGPVGVLVDLFLIPAEIALADFSVSLTFYTYDSITSGHKSKFKWILMPLIIPYLPEPIQNAVCDPIPAICP